MESTALEDAQQLLRNLPADSTYEDIQYHLYVLEKIKKGQRDITQGKSYTHQEAKERLGKWLEI